MREDDITISRYYSLFRLRQHSNFLSAKYIIRFCPTTDSKSLNWLLRICWLRLIVFAGGGEEVFPAQFNANTDWRYQEAEQGEYCVPVRSQNIHLSLWLSDCHIEQHHTIRSHQITSRDLMRHLLSTQFWPCFPLISSDQPASSPRIIISSISLYINLIHSTSRRQYYYYYCIIDLVSQAGQVNIGTGHGSVWYCVRVCDSVIGYNLVMWDKF